jgi:hypothetical protein
MPAVTKAGPNDADLRAALYLRVSTGRQAEADLFIPDRCRPAPAARMTAAPNCNGCSTWRRRAARPSMSLSSIPSAGLPGIISRSQRENQETARRRSGRGRSGAADIQAVARGRRNSGPMGVKAVTSWLNSHGYRTRTGAGWGIGALDFCLTAARQHCERRSESALIRRRR